MQNFKIRNVADNDLAAILIMNEAALPHVNSISLADIARFADMASYFRVVERGDQLSGFLIALRPGLDYQSANYRWFSDHFDDFYYVDRIVVTDSAQGSGLGGALYRDVIDVARKFAPRLTCEVNTRPPNPSSLAFHDRFGFKPVGSQQTEGGSKEVSLLSLDLAKT